MQIFFFPGMEFHSVTVLRPSARLGSCLLPTDECKRESMMFSGFPTCLVYLHPIFSGSKVSPTWPERHCTTLVACPAASSCHSLESDVSQHRCHDERTGTSTATVALCWDANYEAKQRKLPRECLSYIVFIVLHQARWPECHRSAFQVNES